MCDFKNSFLCLILKQTESKLPIDSLHVSNCTVVYIPSLIICLGNPHFFLFSSFQAFSHFSHFTLFSSYFKLFFFFFCLIFHFSFCLHCLLYLVSDHLKLKEKNIYLIMNSCLSGRKYTVKIQSWAIKPANELRY